MRSRVLLRVVARSSITSDEKGELAACLTSCGKAVAARSLILLDSVSLCGWVTFPIWHRDGFQAFSECSTRLGVGKFAAVDPALIWLPSVLVTAFDF